MTTTLYRRPLPEEVIAFSSPAGREVFAEALAAGGLDGYFPLAEQFHTQADPSFCGLGSLVVALNALAIDPGRLWKGPWRWFAEDLLDCCVPLEEVRRRGLDLDELACLARCNGADVELRRADTDDVDGWRAALARAARGEVVVIASYDRSALGQTGSGHFSPIGGYHAARELVLVLDVARFKYPPHWVPASRLFEAMVPVDSATGRSRGWMALRRRGANAALGYSLSCDHDGWHGLGRRLLATIAAIDPVAAIEEVARAIAPLTAHVVVRPAAAAAHQEALAGFRASVQRLPAFARVKAAVGADRAEATLLLLLAIADRLAPAHRDDLQQQLADAAPAEALVAELSNLRAQASALWTLASSH